MAWLHPKETPPTRCSLQDVLSNNTHLVQVLFDCGHIQGLCAATAVAIHQLQQQAHPMHGICQPLVPVQRLPVQNCVHHVWLYTGEQAQDIAAAVLVQGISIAAAVTA